MGEIRLEPWACILTHMDIHDLSLDEVDVAAVIYRMVVGHRRIHPTHRPGCRRCEGFLRGIPSYFGQRNAEGEVTVSAYRELVKVEALKKKANGFSLPFRARTRRHGRVIKDVRGNVQDRTS